MDPRVSIKAGHHCDWWVYCAHSMSVGVDDCAGVVHCLLCWPCFVTAEVADPPLKGSLLVAEYTTDMCHGNCVCGDHIGRKAHCRALQLFFFALLTQSTLLQQLQALTARPAAMDMCGRFVHNVSHGWYLQHSILYFQPAGCLFKPICATTICGAPGWGATSLVFCVVISSFLSRWGTRT